VERDVTSLRKASVTRWWRSGRGAGGLPDLGTTGARPSAARAGAGEERRLTRLDQVFSDEPSHSGIPMGGILVEGKGVSATSEKPAMSVVRRLGIYGLVLVAVFGIAYGVGTLTHANAAESTPVAVQEQGD